MKQALHSLGAASLPHVVAVESTRLWGQLTLIATHTDGTRSRINPDGGSATLSAADWPRIARTLGGTGAATPQLMTQDDAYYYSQPGAAAQYPIYRLILNDAHATRLYLDPVSGVPVGIIDSDARWYRWLHTGLHTLDFSTATRSRPVWDVLMLVLLAGVTVICGTGPGWDGGAMSGSDRGVDWRKGWDSNPRRDCSLASFQD